MSSARHESNPCGARVPGGRYAGFRCALEHGHEGAHSTGVVIDTTELARRRTDLGNGRFGWRDTYVELEWRDES